MAKVLALCLVLVALLTVAKSESDVIMKDGHRVVVVEYDGDGKTNTKVLISPPRNEEVFKNAKKVGETRSSLPEEEECQHHSSQGELICDTIGNCKHKMATMLGRVKDLTAGNHLSDETPREMVELAPRNMEEKAREAKERMIESATMNGHKAQNVLVKTKKAVRDIVTAVAAALGLTKIGSVVGLVGIAAAYGMCVWVTLVSSYVLASVLGRQQVGVVQSKVYPVYFKAVSVGILVGLLGHVISRRRKVFTDAVDMWQAVNLLSSILMVEANATFVKPRAIKAMFERIKAEKEDGRGLDTWPELQSSEAAARTSCKMFTKKMNEDAVKQRLIKLSERLCRLNAYSSLLNVLILMSLTWHFVYLCDRLSLTC